MIIHNTTDIPSRLVAQIYNVVKPVLRNEITSITLRNKAEGKISGNWGMYYPKENRITLCVPQTSLVDYRGKSPVGLFNRHYNNKSDWLVDIIGHEAFHAWQWENEREVYHCKEYLEIGAERYEKEARKLWIAYLASLSSASVFNGSSKVA